MRIDWQAMKPRARDDGHLRGFWPLIAIITDVSPNRGTYDPPVRWLCSSPFKERKRSAVLIYSCSPSVSEIFFICLIYIS